MRFYLRTARMNKFNKNSEILSSIYLVLPGLVIGVFYRVYQLGGQVLGGDEWNSIRIAISYPFSLILTSFSVADNCIPLSVFNKILLETIGLNEWGARFLPLAGGVLILIILPLVIKRIFGARTGLFVSLLLATSPFLVYYSRFARPYSMVALFSILSFFSFYSWLENKKPLNAFYYILFSLIAPFFNLYAFPFVIAPFLFTLMMVLAGKVFRLKNAWVVGYKGLAIIGLFLIVNILICFIPRLASMESVTQKIGEGAITLTTVTQAMLVFCGTRSNIVAIVPVIFFVYGVYRTIRHNRMLLSLAAFTTICTIASVMITKPKACQYSMVFSRYIISCLPLWLIFISVGAADLSLKIAEMAAKTRTARNLISYSMYGLYCVMFVFATLSGPMKPILRNPNNFTNHNDMRGNFNGTVMDINEDQLGRIPRFRRA